MSAKILLQAALDYAKRGWRVIPLHNLTAEGKCTCEEWRAENGRESCPTPGKHPRFAKWAERASTDPRRIRDWWNAWPLANVGVVSGKASGTLVLDMDPRNGGDWSRGRLIEQHGAIECPTAVTGGKGTHEHFRWPEGLDTDQGSIKLDEGLEVLLEGHNVVMPPSLAHAGGDAYFWDIEPAGELPAAPGWLIELVKARIAEGSEGKKPVSGGNMWPPADFGAIARGCAWLQWSVENARTLSEPEWYAQLSILGRCENGEQIAQDVSSAYPGYSARETSAKLAHALRDAGPASCAKIRHSLGGARFCDACQAKVKSPVVLGIAGRSAPKPSCPAPAPASSSTEKVIPAETFELMQAVEAVVAADDPIAVFDLVPRMAAADDIACGKALARLAGHFDRRLKLRDVRKAIAKARRGGGDGGSDGGGGEEPHWRSLLLRAGNGQPRGNLANAITALRHAPEWQGVLWHDEFAVRTVARKRPPIDMPDGEWTNMHDVRTADWLQRRDIEVSIEIAGRAVESVAYDHAFHPVREWLKTLEWDGEPRLHIWLERYLGAAPVEAEPDRRPLYLASVGAKWLISAVARVMRPGCKADCALVLEGPQGARKSTALKLLARNEEWFTDQIEAMESKDASLQTHGVWIIEVAELNSMTKAEVEGVKAFMSRTTERYRPPYAGRLVNIPRQCIFAATTNQDVWNRDETGARRFWPVTCGAIDQKALERDCPQLWAEARVRFEQGEAWWLDQQEVVATAQEEQAARYREDPWDVLVRTFLRDVEEVSIDRIMSDCLDIQKGRFSQADANRVAAILRVQGWKRHKIRTSGGGRAWVYRPYTPAARLASAQQAVLV